MGRKETIGKGTWRKTFLDTGTMTPVLKSLEQKGFVDRNRSEQDKRSVVIKITENGEKLKESAKEIPLKAAGCLVGCANLSVTWFEPSSGSQQEKPRFIRGFFVGF